MECCAFLRSLVSTFREVSEWLKEHAWNACKVQAFEGSNPFLSAIFKQLAKYIRHTLRHKSLKTFLKNLTRFPKSVPKKCDSREFASSIKEFIYVYKWRKFHAKKP